MQKLGEQEKRNGGSNNVIEQRINHYKIYFCNEILVSSIKVICSNKYSFFS